MQVFFGGGVGENAVVSIWINVFPQISQNLYVRSHSWLNRKPRLGGDFLQQSSQPGTSGCGMCASTAPWH